MLREVKLKNFKCFDQLTLPLKNVNMLTGINGVGKSTVIQSILLLRQSYLQDRSLGGLSLNGKYVKLGNAQDVLYEKAAEELIGIGVSADEGDFCASFRYIPDSDLLPMESADPGKLESGIFGNRFSYLSAFRIEPLELYRIANEEEIVRREFGNNGEFALQYLSLFGNEDVENQAVVLQDKLGASLANQTRAWMDRIAPGVAPQITLNPQLRTSEVRYEFIEGKEKTNSYKSMNVGFGITYVLPLIIAILSARQGDIIVVENPEAHIHPAGQRMLGELITRAGAGGVQLFVETHSDHILNGTRLAVKKGAIDESLVQLVFFYKDGADQYKHKYVAPKIYRDGRLDCWPEGFLDEWDKALYDLI
ncbi:AAA family ATPase [Enterocloster asparagiformis]|uniref:AAA family ATPase n=1 Tax=Enterocloster asparagiformis TaxID=333367 RepID=UPI00046560B7|nr:DUF3696 domain-containing protein [Enterocloster asparagiformis]